MRYNLREYSSALLICGLSRREGKAHMESLVSSILGTARANAVPSPSASIGRPRTASDGRAVDKKHHLVVLLSDEAVEWVERRAFELSRGDVPVVSASALVRGIIDRYIDADADPALPAERPSDLKRQKDFILFDGQRAALKLIAADLAAGAGYRVTVSAVLDTMIKEEIAREG